MNSEKVKEIKSKLNDELFTALSFGDKLRKIETADLRDYQKVIDYFEMQCEKTKQSAKNLAYVNDKVVERQQELEEALLDMVVQFCQMGEEGYLKHTFMSAEEQAFNVLEIQYGEKVTDVYKRFFKRWGREWEE